MAAQAAVAMRVVIAEFEIVPARMADFLALAHGFAAECLADEPGCSQFDVVQVDGTPPSVLFYETYDDEAAFAAHGQAAHLARFKAAREGLVAAERPLRRGRRAAP
jgi:quinol monooxygenase YgiN